MDHRSIGFSSQLKDEFVNFEIKEYGDKTVVGFMRDGENKPRAFYPLTVKNAQGIDLVEAAAGDKSKLNELASKVMQVVNKMGLSGVDDLSHTKIKKETNKKQVAFIAHRELPGQAKEVVMRIDNPVKESFQTIHRIFEDLDLTPKRSSSTLSGPSASLEALDLTPGARGLPSAFPETSLRRRGSSPDLMRSYPSDLSLMGGDSVRPTLITGNSSSFTPKKAQQRRKKEKSRARSIRPHSSGYARSQSFTDLRDVLSTDELSEDKGPRRAPPSRFPKGYQRYHPTSEVGGSSSDGDEL